MKSLPLIHTSWLKPFADYFAKRRISLRPYFDAANIEAAQATAGDGWITKHQLYRFLNAVAEGEDMPELGFVVGETINPDTLGAIGEAMASAETLGEAIREFCLLINRHSEENQSWVEEGEEDGIVWFYNRTTNPFPADRRIADHAGLMSVINLVRLAAGSDWFPAKAALQTGPTDAHGKLPGMRHCEIAFDSPATGFAFPGKCMLAPIRRESRHSPRNYGNQARGLLNQNETTAEKLKRLLKEIVGVGGMGPSVKLMADLCNTSPRTLHRRLKEFGVSYQDLLDGVRLDRATALLAESDISVKELAYELGYSGPNNFIRAFKRFTGSTPTEFRRQKAARSHTDSRSRTGSSRRANNT